MTLNAEQPHWRCPMCQDSVTVTAEFANVHGLRHADFLVSEFRTGHIDEHCEEFAREMEVLV